MSNWREKTMFNLKAVAAKCSDATLEHEYVSRVLELSDTLQVPLATIQQPGVEQATQAYSPMMGELDADMMHAVFSSRPITNVFHESILDSVREADESTLRALIGLKASSSYRPGEMIPDKYKRNEHRKYNVSLSPTPEVANLHTHYFPTKPAVEPKDLLHRLETTTSEYHDKKIIESLSDDTIELDAYQTDLFVAMCRDALIKALAAKATEDACEPDLNLYTISEDSPVDERYIPPSATYQPFMKSMSVDDHLVIDAYIDKATIQSPTSTPYEAMQSKRSYSQTLCIQIKVSVTVQTHSGEVHVFDLTPTAVQWIPLAKMPCVVRGHKCVLYGLDDHELLVAGHDPRNLGGYTIENGNMMFMHHGFSKIRAFSVMTTEKNQTEGRSAMPCRTHLSENGYISCVIGSTKDLGAYKKFEAGPPTEHSPTELLQIDSRKPKSLLSKAIRSMMSTVFASIENLNNFTGFRDRTQLLADYIQSNHHAPRPVSDRISWDPQVACLQRSTWENAHRRSSGGSLSYRELFNPTVHAETARTDFARFPHVDCRSKRNQLDAIRDNTAMDVRMFDKMCALQLQTHDRLMIGFHLHQKTYHLPVFLILAALVSEPLTETDVDDFVHRSNCHSDSQATRTWKREYSLYKDWVSSGPFVAVQGIAVYCHGATNAASRYERGISIVRAVLGSSYTHARKQLLVQTILDVTGATLRVHIGVDAPDDPTDFSRRSVMTPAFHRRKTNRLLKLAVRGILHTLTDNFGNNNIGWQFFSSSVVACELSHLFRFRDTSDIPWSKISATSVKPPSSKFGEPRQSMNANDLLNSRPHFKSSHQSQAMKKVVSRVLKLVRGYQQPYLKRIPQTGINPMHMHNETATLSFGHSAHTPANGCRMNGNLFPYVTFKSTGQGSRCGDYAIAAFGTAVSGVLPEAVEAQLKTMLHMSVRMLGVQSSDRATLDPARMTAVRALAELFTTRTAEECGQLQKETSALIETLTSYWEENTDNSAQNSLWDSLQQFTDYRGIARSASEGTATSEPNPPIRTYNDFNLALSFIAHRELDRGSKLHTEASPAEVQPSGVFSESGTACFEQALRNLGALKSRSSAGTTDEVPSTTDPVNLSSGPGSMEDSSPPMAKLSTLRRATPVRILLVQEEVRKILRGTATPLVGTHSRICGISKLSRGEDTPVPTQAFWAEHLARQKAIDDDVARHASDELVNPTGRVYVYYNTQVIGWLQRNEVEATVRQWGKWFRQPGGHPVLRQIDVYFDPSEDKLYVDASEGRLVKAVFELDQHTARPLMSTSMKWLCNRDTGSVHAKLGSDLANATANRIFNDGSVLWVSANAIQFSELRTTLSPSMLLKNASDAFSRKHPYIRRALYMPAVLATTRHDSGHFDAQSPFHRQTVSNKVVTQGLHLPFRFSGVAPYTMVQPEAHLTVPLAYTSYKSWQQESVHTVSIHTSGVNVEDAVAVTYQGQAKLQTTQTTTVLSRAFVLTHALGLKEAGCIARKNTVADPEKLARDSLGTTTNHEPTSTRESVYALLPPPEVIGVPVRLEKALSQWSRAHLHYTRRLDPVTRIIPLHSKVVKGEPLAVFSRILHDDPSNPELSVRALFLIAQELAQHRTAPAESNGNIFDSAPALGPEFSREASESAAGAISAYIMKETLGRSHDPLHNVQTPPPGDMEKLPRMAQKERQALHRSIETVIQKIKARREERTDSDQVKIDEMLQRLEKESHEQGLQIRAINQLLYMDQEPTVWELRRQETGPTCVDIAPLSRELEHSELYQAVKRTYSDKRVRYTETMLKREEVMTATSSGTVTDIRVITQQDGLLQLSVSIQDDIVTGDGCKIQTCGNGSKGVIALQADVPHNTLVRTTPSILVDAISTIPGRSTMYLVVECLASLAVSRYASILLQTTGMRPGVHLASHRREDDELGLPTFVWSPANLECLAYLAESAGKFPLEFGCVVYKRLVDICSQAIDARPLAKPVQVEVYPNLVPLPCAHPPTRTPSSTSYRPLSPVYRPSSPVYMESDSMEQLDTEAPHGKSGVDDVPRTLPDSPVYTALTPVASMTREMTFLSLPGPKSKRRRRKNTLPKEDVGSASVPNTPEDAVQRSCRFPVTCFECGRRVDPVLYFKLNGLRMMHILQLENCCVATYSTFDVLVPWIE